MDNVYICNGAVKLINSLDVDGNEKSYKQDFLSLKVLLEGILGESENRPEDLSHFLDLIAGLPERYGDSFFSFLFGVPKDIFLWFK